VSVAELEYRMVDTTTRTERDLGEFAAFAPVYDDRVKGRVRFGAFERAIAEWRASGKRVPVRWADGGEARNVIGSVDPATMREVAGLGLYVEGKLDLDDSEVAREAWRSMKDNRIALNLEYMTVKSQRRDELNELLELDLLEISVAPGPTNSRKQLLGLKSAAILEREHAADLRRRCDEVTLEAAMGWELPSEPAQSTTPRVPTGAELRAKAIELGLPAPYIKLDAVRAEWRTRMLNLAQGGGR
jgi:HK97 family phage prohead protease